ncbi:hypothetical protein NP233_g6694 [Leucocoprinus birnbaumii]|uniref:Uncharacterized protein n=1 Tax=Leucocoprinus birnbaumii TaxID=56174 RepID=A0AAD5YQP7_9AGAR|nr:hypothetical protein NP233_g6694 [Leucocoprinus birnbaumii]
MLVLPNLFSLLTIESPPHLPPELIEEVVVQAWNLRCTINERILLMTSLPLVNRSVLAAYVRLSSVDVHIPCRSFVDKLLQAMREGTRPFPITPAKGDVTELCRSITIQISQPSSPIRAVHWSAEPPMGIALSDMLYNIRVLGGLPNLRTLTVRYIDVDFNDIFDWARFIDFPKSVQFLNLEFIKTEANVPPPKIVITPPGRSPQVNLWILPHIRRLRVSDGKGGDDEFVSRLIATMPNIESIERC